MARTDLQNMVPSKAALASSSICCCERETLLCRILRGKPETLKSHPSSVKKAGSYISHMTLTKVRSAVRWDLVGARKTLHPGFSLTTLQRSSYSFRGSILDDRPSWNSLGPPFTDTFFCWNLMTACKKCRELTPELVPLLNCLLHRTLVIHFGTVCCTVRQKKEDRNTREILCRTLPTVHHHR